MATLGSTPNWSSWRYYGLNVENQGATGAYTMPQDGIITAVVFYANSDPAAAPTNFVGCVWLNGNAALLCSGSVVSVGAGSESVGGQGWVTSGGINQFVAAGTAIKIGWTRAPSGSMLFSLDPTVEGYVATGGNPGGLGTLEPVGGIGAYIVYTPVSAPAVTTSPASGITTTGATFNGSVTPNGTDATYYFQWGTTTSYGSQTASGDAGTGTAAVNVSTASPVLAGNTTYHYRLVASNSSGTTYGADQSFTTLNPVPPPVPLAPTLTSPASGSAQPMTQSGQAFAWSYNTGGAGGGQTGYAFKVTRSDNGLSYWWNGSTFVTTETWVTSASGTITIPAANWVGGITYTWTVASQDANGRGPYAATRTVISEGPAAAPTLTAPTNASYADLQNTAPTFAWTYNATNSPGGQTFWAMRRKVSGAASYVYWNASSMAWQSTIVWNSGTIQSYTFPTGSWTDGNTYSWSVATQDAGGQGPFAADYSVVAQAPPTVTVTSPTGTIGNTSPTVLWSATFPSGAGQTAYQVRTFTLAQVNTPGFNPATSTAIDDSGVVNSALTSYQIAAQLKVGTPYRTYVNVTETGGEGNAFNAYSAFTATLDLPPTPTIAVVQAADPITGCPLLKLTVTCPLNMLTAVDSSFETGIGTFAGNNAVLVQSSAQHLDGAYALQLTALSSANMFAQSGNYAISPNTRYVAMASFLPGTLTRTVYVQLDWYTSGSAYISSALGNQIGETSTTVWTLSQVSAVSPANAAFARISVYVVGPVILANPAAPTVTPTGTPGTTAYYYKIVARNASGTSAAGAEGSTTTGNANLSAVNYNALSWTAVPGATGYDVYQGKTAGGENLLVASNIAGTTYNDQGTGSAGTPPSTNTSGEVHYIDEVGLFLGTTFVAGTTYGSGATYGGGAVYGGTAWTIGGLIPTAQVAILRSDGVYVRGASLANPAPVSSGPLTAVVNDYEAAPLTAYTYTAVLQAQESNSLVSSAASQPAGATLVTTGWWELDPTNPASAINAQPIQFNPSNTEQSSAHAVLGQATMNVIAYAMQNTDMTAIFETFTAAVYAGLRALTLSQKTVFFSSPFGAGYYFRIAPGPGGSSGGSGSRAHDTQLLPSSAGGPHQTLAITGIAQPRPQV